VEGEKGEAQIVDTATYEAKSERCDGELKGVDVLIGKDVAKKKSVALKRGSRCTSDGKLCRSRHDCRHAYEHSPCLMAKHLTCEA
jgi:hypothetical protein